MSVDIGIIGLAKSGKTTVFNALTRGEADTRRYTQESTAPHIGITKVPEPRLKDLADILQPTRVVPASVTYTDIGATARASVKDRSSSSKWLAELGNLAQLSTADALINVVRAFSDESIPHVEGSLDIERDIANMNLELTFSDLALLERRLERIEVALKGAKPPERSNLLREQEMIMKIKADLGKDVPIRELTLTAEETRALSSYQLFSAKPLLILINIGEDQIPQAESMAAELNSRYSQQKCRVATVCGELEMELAQLDDAAAEELRAEYGMTESGVDRIIKLSYELLGLISFFTTASAEVKAWSVQGGTEAVKAAGKIHSDMEKGFIRAEVIGFDDLMKCGSLPEARKKGLLHPEGKNYIVQDGDVITFLFNV